MNKRIIIVIMVLILLLMISELAIVGDNILNNARKTFYDGNYNESEKLWKELIAEQENQWEANFFLGIISLRKNMLEEAVYYLDRAYNLDSNNYHTLINYARILYHKGKFEHARNKLKEVSEEMREHNEHYYNMSGLLELAENNLYQAVDYFKNSIEINPENYYVLNNLGFSYIRLVDFEQAKVYLERAVSLNPQEGYIYNNMGIIYENLNYLPKAKDNYEKALEIKPDHELAEMNLQRIISKMDN